VTGPFTATLDLGAPFKVQSEPFALAKAVVAKVTTTSAPDDGGKSRTMRVLVLLVVVVAGVLGFTYRRRPTA
jgi:hypothetical protein